MYISLFATLISAGVVGVLVALFLSERRRPARYGEAFRVRFDTYAYRFTHTFGYHLPRIHAYKVRQITHFLVNSMLVVALRFIERIESTIRRVAQFNRQKAKKAARTHTYFHEIAEHKSTHALSDAEKRKRKETALNGDV